MKLPLRWLGEFVASGLDAAAFCERLTMGGLEVEGIEELGDEIRGVVVGAVTATRPHPQGERLTLCDVDSGTGSTVEVVCGAANARAGIRVALAREGAELPGGKHIENATIRGVLSAGMLCSESELGLSDEAASGILELPRTAPLGADVADYLAARETVLEISITPNRGDCLSVLGLAREVALLTGAKLRVRPTRLQEKGAATGEALRVRIEDESGCRRYAARIVRGVKVGPSPLWLRLRLQAAGLRSINNVVDVTNYVMLERGQPLHAFDLRRLPQPEIVVRRAGSTEAIQTLDGVVRFLAADDLLITTGAEAVAIAGVMGGADSEVEETTTDLLLESAWFDPTTVRRTARRLDLNSEASYRFERGVDIEGVIDALDRAAALIVETAGGTVAPTAIDVYPGRRPSPSIVLRPQRVNEILGLEVSLGAIRQTMKALGATVTKAAGGAFTVQPPSFRSDLEREIDLIEEVARVVGYDRIPTHLPLRQLAVGGMPKRMALEREIRWLLRGGGMSELIGLAFATPAGNEALRGVNVGGRPIRLLNPISREESELRTSLLQSVAAMWRHNRNQGATAIAGFSIAKVYWWEGEPREGWRVAGVMAGVLPVSGLGGRRVPAFTDMKGVLENLFDHLGLLDKVSWRPATDWESLHPGKSASIFIEDDFVGVVGALHPDAEAALDLGGDHWLFEIDLERLSERALPAKQFRGLPRFPAVVRDLAIVVEAEFRSDEIVHFVRQWNHDLVEAVHLFDEYVGSPIAPGKKSLAYSIAYRAADRTLTDEEVNALQDQLVAALEKKFRVEHRQ